MEKVTSHKIAARLANHKRSARWNKLFAMASAGGAFITGETLIGPPSLAVSAVLGGLAINAALKSADAKSKANVLDHMPLVNVLIREAHEEQPVYAPEQAAQAPLHLVPDQSA